MGARSPRREHAIVSLKGQASTYDGGGGGVKRHIGCAVAGITPATQYTSDELRQRLALLGRLYPELLFFLTRQPD